ncbi:MAG: ABC transporter substrate-binding protein [Peptococcaceae bacterium]|nr:ABC transporter substrate-binding protein [Peptococcaceae bacterium]
MKSKKLMKGVAIATIAAMSMGMLAGCGGGKDEAKEYKVGVVQLVQHGALDQANAGMIAGLADNGFVEGENLVVKQENAQNDQSNLQSIAQSFIADEVDLILAIATPAAQVMAANTEEIPIVGTAITSFEGAGLVESDDAPGYNVTGTNDMNPVEEQVNLLLQLKPDAKVIGTIYTAAEVNSQIQVDLLDKVVAAKGLTVEKRTIQNVNDIQQAAQSLVGVADALWLPTDNNVASAMPNVVGVTDPAGIITITGEESMTVAGGTATYSFSYYDIGYNAGVMAAQILKGEADPATLPVQSPKAEDLTAVLNMEAIASLGVEVPQDLLDSAKKVNEAE